jgi:glutamine amidotransferase PdxT
MEPLTLIALAALVAKIVSVVKYAQARDGAAVGTQLAVWGTGVGVIALAAQADVAASIEVVGTTLGALDFPSQILVGLSLGSFGSQVYDFKRAIDGTDSAREPSLGAGT